MKLLRKICKKIIWIATFIYCLYLMALGYFATLLIVKPRNISFLNNFIHESLSAIDSNTTLDTQKLSLQWDRSSYSLILVASENHISHNNGITLYIPEIAVNISRANLFFARLKINNIKANDAVANLSNMSMRKTSKQNVEGTTYSYISLHNRIINFQKFIRNASLDNFEIILTNENKINTTVRIASHQNNDQIYSILKITVKTPKNDLSLYQNCTTTIANKKVTCEGKSDLVDSSLIHTIGLPILASSSNFQTNLTYDILSMEKRYFDRINFALTSKDGGSVQLTNITNKIDFSSLTLDGKITDALNLDFALGLKNSEIEGSFSSTNRKNNSYHLSLHGENIHSHNIDKLWPLKTSKTLRSFLVNNVSATINKFTFDIKLLRKSKSKKITIDDIYLKLKLTDGTVLYSPLFPEIENIETNLSLTKNHFNMAIQNATAGKVSIKDTTLRIPAPLMPRKMLHISSKILGHPNSYILYLLNNIITDNKLTSLTKILNLDGSIQGTMTLKVPLKHKIDIEDIYLSTNLRLHHFFLYEQLIDSELDLNIEKTANSADFLTSLSCRKCNLTNDILNYHEQGSNYHKFSSTLNISDTGTIIKDFSLTERDLTKISGSGTISGSGFTNFFVNIDHLGANTLDVEFNQIGDNIFYDINGEVLDLSNIFNLFEGDSKTNSILNGKIKTVILPIQEDLHNVELSSKYLKNDHFMSYITGHFNDNSDFLDITQFITPLEERIVIESNNIGQLSKMLNISDRVDLGKAHISLQKGHNQKNYNGKLRIHDFVVQEIDFLNVVKKLDLFKKVKKALEQDSNIKFKQAKANFTLGPNNIGIDHFTAYSKHLGITAKGEIDLSRENFNIKGVLVPAYQINRLFGIADIPYIGNLITGGNGAGIISPKYKVTGSFDNPKFDINPLSAVTPGFVRNIFDFSLRKAIKKSDKCLKDSLSKLEDNDKKTIHKQCR